MYDSPFKKGLPWLIAGLLLLTVSSVLYLYDLGLSDEDILTRIENKLNEDFRTCVATYSQDGITPSAELPADCHACELIYSASGRLNSWTNKEYLPTQKHINRLRDVPDSVLVRKENRTYYQIRRKMADSTSVVLIPLWITYDANNEFLLPYIFMGRWEGAFEGYNQQQYLNSIQVSIGKAAYNSIDHIELTDDDGNVIISYSGVPVLPFRAPIRYMVLICLMLGALLLGVFLRIYSLNRWHYRYYINYSLFFGVLAVRLLLYWVELPGNYVDAGLFSPDVLAFHRLAPSLGEMTINIFTVAVLVWIAYMHVFKMCNLFYRRIISQPYLAWPAMFGTIAISSLLLRLYIDIFRKINVNSQVDIEFSNFFKADTYSFLILLDVGILLLAISLIIFTLLKLNVLFARQNKVSSLLIAFHILAALVCNFFLHSTAPVLALILAFGLLGLGLTVYRVPFRPILHQDLVNFLIIVLIFSVMVTYNVIVGVNLSNEQKADQIAERVLGSQVANTVFSFTKSTNAINEDIREIRNRKRAFNDINQLRDWMVESYLAPNFKEFDVRLYVYEPEGKRIDQTRDFGPAFGPDADIPIEVRGEKISDNLYQLPNTENKYLDLYVGSFTLDLGDSTDYFFLMELTPNSRGTEGLAPLLSLDQDIYEDIRLINSFDHGVYREGALYNENSKTPFPIYFEGHENVNNRFTRMRDGQKELVRPIGTNKIVIVRFPQQSFIDILTTFSFIFYFYIIGTVLIIGLPVLALRTLRSGQFAYNVPLRAKIRFGLFSISILPLLLIMILLSYNIRNRYNEEAKQELSEEAARITKIIEQDYLNLYNDPFSRITLLRSFQDRILGLESVVRNDINIFDEFGKRLATTQPLIFETGISSDLMNATAYDSLRNGRLSDLVIREKIGNLEYYSGYRPVIGTNNLPIGYVNVPYLSKQDQLEEQITDFLSYLANIYLLIFLLINVAAVLVSGTITKPLSMIQQRLSTISFGNVNEPISYESKDEIGEIVTAYNKMVKQLSESEEKLSQNQREMAWRQMARQVAHEIKNPLTPMKLSIQHLLRAWNEQTGRLETMFPKVMKTLLVQIDSMVKIANSFSEFAKMPEPVKSTVNVNEVLLEVVDLYTQSEEAIWLIDIPSEEFWAYADRDQLSRCFNNIIKNGLQAIESNNGIIHISMRIFEGVARIEIKDNGKGITPDDQKKIFEPSFSTKTSGMGLGLAIVKRIIENTGGQIYFESQEGEGTTFFIEIPATEDTLVVDGAK